MALRSLGDALPVFPRVGRRASFFRGSTVALLAALGAPGAGCQGDPSPPQRAPSVTDDAGRAVRLEPVPRRVVSLVPSATELLLALGEADRLVARTGFDEQPALAHLPSLGRTLWPALETIEALGPDLVLAPPDGLSGGLAARLEALGVRVYEVDAQRMDEVLSTLARIATLLGRPARGDSLVRRLADEIDALGRPADRPPVSALYLVWHTPPRVAGAGTYVDDLLSAAGGRNVFADVPGWPEVSLEEVIERDPRFLIVPRGEGHSLQPEWLAGAPGWRGLAAVREGRLVVVDSDLFNRPGPRVAEAARTLARALHADRVGRVP